ncbi:hypothetical protein Tco_0804655 [Tanacetum coccineum]|uniref:Cation efflux protein cytoplasmic domain-containing protein n=1 Tax=Tanacetum coccineum TaxID=301880 RepID=A0ABQ5A8T0_9ASTR
MGSGQFWRGHKKMWVDGGEDGAADTDIQCPTKEFVVKLLGNAALREDYGLYNVSTWIVSGVYDAGVWCYDGPEQGTGGDKKDPGMGFQKLLEWNNALLEVILKVELVDLMAMRQSRVMWEIGGGGKHGKVRDYYKKQERLLEGFNEMETINESGYLPDFTMIGCSTTCGSRGAKPVPNFGGRGYRVVRVEWTNATCQRWNVKDSAVTETWKVRDYYKKQERLLEGFNEMETINESGYLPDMLLTKAHNIGEMLQEKLEQLSEVERAFVHIDFEFSHRPEHKAKV